MYGVNPDREKAFSVSQVNEYIKMLLEGNPTLKNIWVVGEISGAKLYASGHLYFSVKDEDSVLSAVMFRSSLAGVDFRPEDGMRVLIHGRLSAYPPRGQYQLIVDRMIPDGAGAMALAFEQLKHKLAAEGLFDCQIIQQHFVISVDGCCKTRKFRICIQTPDIGLADAHLLKNHPERFSLRCRKCIDVKPVNFHPFQRRNGFFQLDIHIRSGFRCSGRSRAE